MPHYDLNTLGHEEFERLSQALVQQVIAPGAKVYGMGKDGSREATFEGKAPYPSSEEQWDGKWIFQAKFHDSRQIGQKEARRRLLVDLDDELSNITQKYQYACDNYILMTNVSLTPVHQAGIKDTIDNKLVPKYKHAIRHIHVWGAEEICRFLDQYEGIRTTYAHFLVSGDIIAFLLKIIKREQTSLDEVVKLYCQYCHDHEKYAALDDAGEIEEKRVDLERIFIDLDVKPPSLPKDPQILERVPEWLKQAAEEDQRTSALSYLLDDSISNLVIVGGPGEGKSTLGQHIAQVHRNRLTGNASGLDKKLIEGCTPRLPFRILLREYAQYVSSENLRQDIFHYLALKVSQAGRDVTAEDLHKIIKSSAVLLILDGLDEVPEKNLRTRVLDNITSFISQVRGTLNSDLRVIATTRPYGYSQEFDPMHYLHLTLQKLSPLNATQYAIRWIDARLQSSPEAQKIRNTFDNCLGDRVVSCLTQTPLQVTILLVIIRAKGTPPKQREELFESYMSIIYQREQKNRPELLRTEADVIYGLHKYLAYILHRRAEKDATAALMDLTEFKEKVIIYLHHSNPKLLQDELEAKANQIITEASQRLVLIESPQAGKVGFGLATTREFFAAAHLVDTGTNTDERYSRLYAIARTPYWRNVALFFAGRVGRSMSGEAAGIIDVCRKIDTEREDRILNRGAELAMAVIDDRVMRQPYSEIGAIEHSLTLLDSQLRREPEDLIPKLVGISNEFKDRMVRPWMEDQLKNRVPSNFDLYAEIYQGLFGMSAPLHDAIAKAAQSDKNEIGLQALGQAIKNGIIESWVIDLFERLVKVVPVDEMVRRLMEHWPNLKLYLDSALSVKARGVLGLIMLVGIVIHEEASEVSLSNITSQMCAEMSGSKKKNSLLLWAVCQLVELSEKDEEREYWITESPLEFSFPTIVNPNTKVILHKNEYNIRDFLETFSAEDDPFIKLIVAIFESLLEPDDLQKFLDVSRLFNERGNSIPRILLARDLFGTIPENEERKVEYQKELYALRMHYQREGQYRNDTWDINKLINKTSKMIGNHPYRLLLWINFGFEPSVDVALDSEIVDELELWLNDHGLTERSLRMGITTSKPVLDQHLCESVLKVIKRRLKEGGKSIEGSEVIAWYALGTLGLESTISDEVHQILESVLDTYSTRKIDIDELDNLYWSALFTKGIKDEYMQKLYSVVRKNPHFPSVPRRTGNIQRADLALMSMLRSDNQEVSRLAAVSLSAMHELLGRVRRRPEWRERPKLLESWVGSKFWELAKKERDIWHARYINGMAACQLSWNVHRNDWLAAIKGGSNEEVERSWCRVIGNSGYCDAKDREALLDFLLSILESGEGFSESVRTAAVWRLYEIVSEEGSVGLDEQRLNLPLPPM